jgi:hypothetical protein
MLGKNDKENKDAKSNESSEEEEVVSRAPRASRDPARRTYDRASFRKPHDLSFPEALIKYMEEEGYFLRWAAIVDAKTKQFTNEKLNHYLSLGGELVTAREIKESAPEFLSGLTKYRYEEEWADLEDERNSVEGIRKEHLVLIKLPIAYRDFRQEENRRTVEDQLAAAQQEYKKSSDDTIVNKFDHGSSNLKLKKGFFED